MKPSPIAPLLLGLVILPGLPELAGCPSSPSSDNPKELWLATDMVETRVKLVDTEPGPF